MDVDAFLTSLREDPAYAGQIVHVHREPAAAARWGSMPVGLHPQSGEFLAALGVERLYTHQTEAIGALLAGEDVLITTGAASGKSLCYQVPILETLLKDPESTALLLFPTKALARDQVAAWNRALGALSTSPGPVAAYDGDAGQADRRSARASANVIVTNPEMLHLQLLPGHGRWARLFRNLRFVVLDEVHTYSGFFGANMANVMRRLERVCEHHGSRPQVVCCSATLPAGRRAGEMAALVGRRALHHIAEDGAPHGAKTYVFWNPPRIKRRRWRGRRSANVEAHELMVKLIRRRVTTITFSKARNTAEMIYRYVRETLQTEEPDLADRVVPYRGGYSSEERREMERRLREGELLGVSATRALELGIDVGSLEACIIVGYPGLLTAFFQQAGRAGRTDADSLVILVGIDTAINQYVMTHPEYIFDRPIEGTVIDCDNPFVVLGHLRCASAELPLPESEAKRFGYASGLALEVLEEKQKVLRRDAVYYHAASEQPAHEVRLRGYGDATAVVVDADSGRIIDRLDKFRAQRIFYPGAIYFHRGDTYALVEHDTERNVIQVRRAEVSYYTDPVTGTSVDHVDVVLAERPLGTGRAYLGEVFAVEQTPLYEKVHFYTLDRISQHETHIAPNAYEAMAFWVETPEGLPGEVGRLGLNAESGMKGILYCASRVLPLFLTSDTNDFDWSLGCRNTTWHTMFWFEFYMHGIGHAEQGYERLEEILGVTLEHLLTCDCEDGCPNCTSRLITPYHVRNIELGEGTVPSRRAAVVVLNSLLTGQGAAESLALLKEPRARRGQAYLPTITGERRQRKPHRLPLDDRLRRLLARKLERGRSTRQPVGHTIEPTPPVGVPAPESPETLETSDAGRRAGRSAVRRSGDPTVRRLRQRLREGAKGKGVPVAEPAAGEGSGGERPSVSTSEEVGGRVVTAGDPLAERARRLKRQRRKTEK